MNIYTSAHSVKAVKLGPIQKSSANKGGGYRMIYVESDGGSFELSLHADKLEALLVKASPDGIGGTPSQARRLRSHGTV